MADKYHSDNELENHKVILDAHTRSEFEILRTGEYYIYREGAPEEDRNIAADMLFGYPLLIVRDITIDRIAINVRTAAAEGDKVARLGIYKNGTNLLPGDLLLDAGTVNISSTGVKTITINQALAKGIYHLAHICNFVYNPWVQRSYHYSSKPSLGIHPTNFCINWQGWNKAQGYGALPNPFSTDATLYTGFIPLIALRIASLD